MQGDGRRPGSVHVLGEALSTPGGSVLAEAEEVVEDDELEGGLASGGGEIGGEPQLCDGRGRAAVLGVDPSQGSPFVNFEYDQPRASS